MASFRPFMVHFVYGSTLSFRNGFLDGDDSTRRNSFPLRNKIDLATIVDMAYRFIGVDKDLCNLKLILWYEFQGNVCCCPFLNDQNLETIYYLSEIDQHYQAQIEVQFVPVSQSTFVDQLRSVMPSQVVDGNEDAVRYEETGPAVDNEDDARSDESAGGLDNSEDEARSEESGESPSDFTIDSDVSQDSDNEEVRQVVEMVSPPVGFVHERNDVDNRLPFDEDDEEWVYWCKESGEIQKGMIFKSKSELDYAVRLWNMKRGRELIVEYSRPKFWKAKCYTRGEHYKGHKDRIPCMWTVTGSQNSKHGMWHISKWKNAHNCYGSVTDSNNRSLKSTMIATEVDHLIRIDIACPIKDIQAHIKKTWNVEVCYDKAWNGRRIAIERIFGTWESNFAELPKYIDALCHANPETVVVWDHAPDSSSDAYTFKYVFWAFGPAIRAFQLCIPVLFVDGTHLKGSYKGKLLTAVTKNANGKLLPVAYAMVDEETNESWSWFLHQFWTHVWSSTRGDLCVISDRHKGIINAMKNIDGWYHRYCLRHVRSNLMAKYKNHELKRLCWTIGCTTQSRKYLWGVEKITEIDEAAWQYLYNINPTKWTILHDTKHRRWGNLTTNIAESLNNVMRGARLLPIKACIEYTFDKTRLNFVENYQEACTWTSPLAPKMWNLYEMREENALSHQVDVYDRDTGVYKVLSRFETNDEGGNDYIVQFKSKKCSCGKWQNQRFPCSHAIAVCRKRGGRSLHLVSKWYTTKTYKDQHHVKLAPLEHPAYWTEPDWMIQADYSKIVTHRGRRRSRRIPNEMDNREPGPRCKTCNGQGHNSKTCPRRFANV